MQVNTDRNQIGLHENSSARCVTWVTYLLLNKD